MLKCCRQKITVIRTRDIARLLQILRSAGQHEALTAAALAAFAGLRRDELITLKWQDAEHLGTLHIPGMNGFSARTIELN